MIKTIDDALAMRGPSLPLARFDIPLPGECPGCKGSGRQKPHRSITCYGEGCKLCDFTGAIADRKGTDPDGWTCAVCYGDKVAWPEHTGVTLRRQLSIAARYYAMLLALPGIEVDLSIGSRLPFRFDGGEGCLMPLLTGSNYANEPGYWCLLESAA